MELFGKKKGLALLQKDQLSFTISYWNQFEFLPFIRPFISCLCIINLIWSRSIRLILAIIAVADELLQEKQ